MKDKRDPGKEDLKERSFIDDNGSPRSSITPENPVLWKQLYNLTFGLYEVLVALRQLFIYNVVTLKHWRKTGIKSVQKSN